MKHFTNFFSAEFGVIKRQNKLKRNIVDGADIMRNTNDDYPQRYRVEDAIKQGVQPNNRYKSNGRAQRARLETSRQIAETTSRPVISGEPNEDYRLPYKTSDLPKETLVKKYNRKQILSNAKSRNGYATVASSPLMNWQNSSTQFLQPYSTKSKYDNILKQERSGRKNPLDTDYKLKPALRAKSERLDFSPSTEQLQGVLNKNYPDYKNYVDNPRDLLITGSPNHTWLTNNGKYMEMPIGQEEMPLNASMWKGRKSGMRLPDYEVKAMGEQGSPVKGLKPANLYNMNGKNSAKQLVENNLIQTSDSYNNQIANKRYVPKE